MIAHSFIMRDVENNEELFHYDSLSLRSGEAGREHKVEGLKSMHGKIYTYPTHLMWNSQNPTLVLFLCSTVWSLVSSTLLGPTRFVLFTLLPPWKSAEAQVSDTINQHSSPAYIPISLLGIFVVCSLSSFHQIFLLAFSI